MEEEIQVNETNEELEKIQPSMEPFQLEKEQIDFLNYLANFERRNFH